MERDFWKMVRNKWAEGKFLCVGLDSKVQNLPSSIWTTRNAGLAMLDFNKRIIDATSDIVCAYKINSAFYEAVVLEGGIEALWKTIEHIYRFSPDVPVILDAKRADIGNSNDAHILYAFNQLGADALTVHPYLGSAAMKPFLEQQNKGFFVLCRTSNDGAGEFQDLMIGPEPLFMHVARNVANKWNEHDNCALVVGATYPDEGRRIREIAPDIPFLIPGIGSQGGNLEATVSACKDSNGAGMIINVSRSVIFASPEADFAQIAKEKALWYHEQIIAAL